MNNHRPISVKDKLFCDREAQLDLQIHLTKIIHVVLGLWVILLRGHSCTCRNRTEHDYFTERNTKGKLFASF